MNLRRGSFRVWVICSLLWLLGVAFLLASDSVSQSRWLALTAFAISIPIGIFILGWCCLWAIDGFKGPRPDDER